MDHTLDDDAITWPRSTSPRASCSPRSTPARCGPQGFDVRHARRVGTREVVLPALERRIDRGACPTTRGAPSPSWAASPRSDPDVVAGDAASLARPHAVSKRSSPRPRRARNGLVVTTRTATEHGLRSVSDLRDVAAAMTIGGPPECPDARTLPARASPRTYGLDFESFLPLDAGGPITAEAVEQGTVDVGVLFTSDGSLAQHGLVLLQDDRELQPAENVTPLVRRDAIERFGPGLTEAIDAVSAELTTTELRGSTPSSARASLRRSPRPAGWTITSSGTPPSSIARTREDERRDGHRRSRRTRPRTSAGAACSAPTSGGAPPARRRPLPRELGRSGKFWLFMAAYFVATVIGVVLFEPSERLFHRIDTAILRWFASWRTAPLTDVMETIALLTSRWIDPHPPMGNDRALDRRPPMAAPAGVPRCLDRRGFRDVRTHAGDRAGLGRSTWSRSDRGRLLDALEATRRRSRSRWSASRFR